VLSERNLSQNGRLDLRKRCLGTHNADSFEPLLIDELPNEQTSPPYPRVIMARRLALAWSFMNQPLRKGKKNRRESPRKESQTAISRYGKPKGIELRAAKCDFLRCDEPGCLFAA
jgi:hypothetical protein